MTRRGRGAHLALLILLLSMLIAAAACAGDTGAKPPASAVQTAESTARQVTIQAPDGGTPVAGGADKTPVALNAHVFGSGPTGVILAHMRTADQTSWFPLATNLAQSGQFTVLTFDFRGFGASAGEKAFDRMDTDLTAAYDYMRDTLGIGRIFLLGASIGGTAALVVAARLPVAGVAVISAPAAFENLDALAAVPRIDVPTLFIASQDDVTARRSLEQLAAAAPGSDQQVYEGNAHGTDIFKGPFAIGLQQRLIGFLTRD